MTPNFKVDKIRSPEHLAFVRSQQCLVNDGKGNRCNGVPVVAHHLTIVKGERGIGQKVGDNLTLSLCHSHHCNLHDIGEKQWWKSWGIDAEQEARNLARLSPDEEIRNTVIE